MLDLNFQVEGAEPQRFAAAPLLLFKLRLSEAVAEGTRPTPIHTVALRCQVRIEPGRRRYHPSEQGRLLDLFGTPERWGQTLRSMLWMHVGAVVPPFVGTVVADLPVPCSFDLPTAPARGRSNVDTVGADLPVPCSFDFNLAATKYFAALEEGDLPLSFLFSGTIFYEGVEGALQVTQISWEKEASYRLPASTWRELMDLYYPNSASVHLRKDVFDRLDQYRSRQGLPTWEQALERLLSAAEDPVTP
jgi:hypothetical protein